MDLGDICNKYKKQESSGNIIVWYHEECIQNLTKCRSDFGFMLPIS